ncbi:5'-3' exonuclease H3TH domain-containing protein [Psychromonas sp. SP041]|uniref:5'-3' exonuclease H3TH domain-containing protein n=1 Tax=Psychromonas sp. SP041 TaxID=1365007 RepID=UPI0010C7BC0C|nr:5'-3' exonuclease H3TH domain-containing protein [Psychromonas sp. SP041]
MKILLIDSNLIFGSMHYLLLKDGEINPTVFFDRCLKVIKNSINDLKPTHALFCLDDLSRSEKKITCPEYRLDSFSLPLEFLPLLPNFIENLKLISVKSLSVSFSESHDIAATMVSKSRNASLEASYTLMFSDKRLYSLIGDDLIMYNPFGVNNKKYFRQESLRDVSELSVSAWSDFIALAGYKSRGIKGVSGVGKKKAESLIFQYGSIDNMLNNIDSIEIKKESNTESFRREVERARYLVSLNSGLPLGINLNQIICNAV